MAEQGIRIDRWLWAARFFKTRGLAQSAVTGGKVHVDGQRVKPARPVKPGDRVEITRGTERLEVVVSALARRRGPATEARLLYEETPASLALRTADREARRRRAESRGPAPDHRPDKRSRRRLIRLARGGSES
ncbi:MAG: S4 domain-containing protein [Gammaproteobacteria bacterium]